MNSVISKIITVLVSLFFIVYVCYHAYIALYNPYQTEIVKLGNYVQDVDLDGFFVRSESVIDAKKNGVISYNYKNSQKISKNAVVAGVYESENDLYTLKTIQSLKKEKAILNEVMNNDAQEGQKLDLLNSKIAVCKAELIKQVDESDFTDIDSVYNELMLNMNKMSVCVDDKLTFEDTIKALDNKIAELQKGVSSQSGVINSPNSGYFSNTIDGYESVFKLDMLSNLTIESAQEAMKKNTPKKADSIGKIVNESYWYFVSVVSSKEAELFDKYYQRGDTISLKFNSKSTREISVSIDDIITQKDNDKAVVVFKSLFLDEDLINMRFETPKAMLGDHSGIVIPKEAIRIQNGVKDPKTGKVEDSVKGVYGLYGRTVRFKRIDPVYEDEYVVISKQTSDSNYVSVYDQVIIKGKDLNAGV